MKKVGLLVCLLLFASACGGTSETVELTATTTTAIPATTVTSTTTTAIPATTVTSTTTTMVPAVTLEPLEVLQYGLWVGLHADAMTTGDWVDTDSDGIDDRWQIGPGEPDSRFDKVDYLTSNLPPTFPSQETNLCKIENSYNPLDTDPVRTGFPRSEKNINPEGTAKFALVLVDFPDAEGKPSEIADAYNATVLATEYYEEVSNGKFKVEWVLADSFARLPNSSIDYDPTVGNPGGDTSNKGFMLSKEIIELVDPQIDFTGVSAIFFHIPESTPIEAPINSRGWGMLYAIDVGEEVASDGSRGAFATDEGAIMFAHGAPTSERILRTMGYLLAHEIGHTLGLPDLYMMTSSSQSGRSLSTLPMGQWGLMSDYMSLSKSINAWNRWFLGWIDPEDVYCQTAETLTSNEITLQPLVRNEEGYRAAMIRLEEDLILVIESRHGMGVDSSLGDNKGVLVYTVDTSLGHFEGPHKIRLPVGRDPSQQSWPWPDALLKIGDEIVVEGLTIELLQTGDYDRIRISNFLS